MIENVIDRWLGSSTARNLHCHEVIPGKKARSCALPGWLDARLERALRARGYEQLYAHQGEACEHTRKGRDLVVATPTASGKTLCYNLPVFQELLCDPGARAIYLFPTKALARDQMEEARSLAEATGEQIGIAVYDGDTPPDERRAARGRARILATNPDMLHGGILPHHPNWAELFSGLRYVVIDELHTYRGVFGSHMANVLRRLQRIARFHGADPRFIATSATIANPGELARQLTGRTPVVIGDSGAPAGERHFLIYNPPLIDPALGIRESYVRAACRLTRDLVNASVNTLVFCRSRLTVEVMVRQLRDVLSLEGQEGAASVRGYRGGYLPDRRREVEHAMRKGRTQVVVATSALELGIDIGSLDAVVMAGWPGSRAATWQRAGRAGRRLGPSLAVLVASSDPLDQYVVNDQQYLFGQAAEQARVNPDNASILIPHLKCAAYELPFARQEPYGQLAASETEEVLECLADATLLHRSPTGYHYMGHPYPATEVHLRGPMAENFLVVQRSGEPGADAGTVIAEVDYQDATQVLHDNAIYQLEGRQYQVLSLDHDNHKAFVSRIDVDYYTDAMTHTRVRILEQTDQQVGIACHGEVHVVHRVVGFKKIKLHTGENIGYGEVSQPEREMHSTSLWLNIPAADLGTLGRSAPEIAEAALAAAFALHSTASLILMSDPRDIGRAVGDARSGWFAVAGRTGRGPYATPGDPAEQLGPAAPTIFLFDRYPGGTGLSERLYSERRQLLHRTRRSIERCACARGCPGCVGPGSRGEAKALAARLLDILSRRLSEAPARPVPAPDASPTIQSAP